MARDDDDFTYEEDPLDSETEPDFEEDDDVDEDEDDELEFEEDDEYPDEDEDDDIEFEDDTDPDLQRDDLRGTGIEFEDEPLREEPDGF